MTTDARTDFLAAEMVQIELGISLSGWDWWEQYEMWKYPLPRKAA